MNTTESNKLIAEFMGGKMAKDVKFGDRMGKLDIWLPFHGICHISTLKYHSSYDWLMSVVEKIESQNQRVEIVKHICRIRVNENVDIVFSENMSKIEAVYNAIVKFILWYNKQKTAS